MTRLVALALAVASLPVAAAVAQTAPGALSARPSPAASTTLAPGITKLGDLGHVYRPPGAPEGPRPLILLLHGAGDDSRRFLEMLKPIADERGFIMAAASPAARTWDMAAELGKRRRQSEPDFGADVPRIDALLRQIFDRAAVEPQQVAVVGFSDGAAYGLSLALANPQLFAAVVAFAPGFAKVPSTLLCEQRIFIAHGRSDRVIPVNVGRAIADGLRSSGGSVEFRQFKGDHSISRPVLLDGLDHVRAPADCPRR